MDGSSECGVRSISSRGMEKGWTRIMKEEMRDVEIMGGYTV